MPTWSVSYSESVIALASFTTKTFPARMNTPTSSKPSGPNTAKHALDWPAYKSSIDVPSQFGMSPDIVPSPHDHFNRGLKIRFLRWEQLCPNDPAVLECLKCTVCNQSLLEKPKALGEQKRALGGKWSINIGQVHAIAIDRYD